MYDEANNAYHNVVIGQRFSLKSSNAVRKDSFCQKRCQYKTDQKFNN